MCACVYYNPTQVALRTNLATPWGTTLHEVPLGYADYVSSNNWDRQSLNTLVLSDEKTLLVGGSGG